MKKKVHWNDMGHDSESSQNTDDKKIHSLIDLFRAVLHHPNAQAPTEAELPKPVQQNTVQQNTVQPNTVQKKSSNTNTSRERRNLVKQFSEPRWKRKKDGGNKKTKRKKKKNKKKTRKKQILKI